MYVLLKKTNLAMLDPFSKYVSKPFDLFYLFKVAAFFVLTFLSLLQVVQSSNTINPIPEIIKVPPIIPMSLDDALSSGALVRDLLYSNKKNCIDLISRKEIVCAFYLFSFYIFYCYKCIYESFIDITVF